MLRVNGVTVSRGGPCWPGFLLMRDPYKGPYGDLTRGVSFIPREWCEIVMRFCAERNLRLNVVVAGTGEHDEYLDQLEAVNRDTKISDRHWILQHVFFLEPAQARRYAALGVEATTSMSFSWGKGDMFIERVGERLLEHLIPLKRMLDAGMTVACGSDWGPKNIFEHVALATTHEFCGSGRRNDGPAQRVTREQALAMWTREAARVLQWEGVGTLAVGGHADLIVVDRDPLECSVEELPATKVLRTVLGGKTVHDTLAL
jgi:predicted amidohydrolase YtcJ